MASWTLVDSGSQTATISTEHTLSASSPFTTNGTYVLKVSLGAMANADKLQLRVYTKVRSADGEEVYIKASYRDAQFKLASISIPIPSDVHVKFTLKQTAGTGRAFPWAILRQ